MNILITGARAPAALDLARRCRAAGHTVFMADSLRFGMAMFSRVVAGRKLLPSPVEKPDQFVDALRSMIDAHHIELIVPTCEEVFFLSRYRDLLPCSVLVDDFEKLNAIHNKFEFSRFAGNAFAAVPETHLIESTDQLQGFQTDSIDWVFKPVYSRFATRALIGPQPAQLGSIKPAPKMQWVAQRRIRGQEYSTYGIAHAGVLQAHVCYRSLYRVGQGSGIYFEPVQSDVIRQFVETFVRQTQFTGQIGFDLIETDQADLFAIEANPRATSGVHLFGKTDALIKAIVGDAMFGCAEQLVVPTDFRPVMVEFAMPLWGFIDALRRRSVRHYFPDLCSARFATFSLSDVLPTLALPLSLMELGAMAMRRRCSLVRASTVDIEWNGQLP